MVSASASILLFAASLAAAPADVENGQSGDLAKFQGTWAAMAGPKKNIPVTLEIRGARATVRITPPIGRPFTVTGGVKLDESTTPRSLDWVDFTGLDDQELPVIPGIYRIDGDELVICNGGPNNPRPAEFRRGEGALADVVTFRRVNADATPIATR